MRRPRRHLGEQTVDHPPDGFLAILLVEVKVALPAVVHDATAIDDVDRRPVVTRGHEGSARQVR